MEKNELNELAGLYLEQYPDITCIYGTADGHFYFTEIEAIKQANRTGVAHYMFMREKEVIEDVVEDVVKSEVDFDVFVKADLVKILSEFNVDADKSFKKDELIGLYNDTVSYEKLLEKLSEKEIEIDPKASEQDLLNLLID